MPLLVKPNWRRMQYMRDSPSENSVPQPRYGYADGLRWERLLVGAGVVGLIAVGLIAMSGHF